MLDLLRCRQETQGMRNWLPALGVLIVALLALPLVFVMFLAERGLLQQRSAIRKTMTARDRRTGRNAALAWLVSVLAAFGAVWTATGDPALGLLGVAIGSAALGLLGP